jgi:hypothetical protein
VILNSCTTLRSPLHIAAGLSFIPAVATCTHACLKRVYRCPSILRSELSAIEVARTGSFNPNPILALTSANGYGGFSFDFDFDFATAGGNINTRFTDGDSVTMKLMRAGGLTEADFNYSAPHAGREFYSGAHIISLADGKSAFVGAAAPAVPEPATIIAGALVLLPLGASTIRILTRKPAA